MSIVHTTPPKYGIGISLHSPYPIPYHERYLNLAVSLLTILNLPGPPYFPVVSYLVFICPVPVPHFAATKVSDQFHLDWGV